MAQNVAVAIVADSSVALAGQWQHTLREYISPLFQRLLSGQQRQLYIAFVTYALAETTPSPVVAKRYFSLPAQVTKELKEEPSKLGLGSTTTGGSMGMAALEGYAAALEMFDLYHKQTVTSNKENMADKPNPEIQPQLFHLFHVCAGAPDGTIHPLHNQSTELDALSWRTLPEELKKRNINLNIIMLRNIPTFVELHKTTVPDPCKPWYDVRQGHSVLLSSQSLWIAPQPKRKDDQPNENSDTKRVRIASPRMSQSSPIPPSQPKTTQPLETKPPNIAGPSSQPPPDPQPQPQPQPPIQPLTSNAPAGPPRIDPAIAQRHLQTLEENLRKQVTAIAILAQQPGNAARIEEMKRTLQPKIQMLRKLKEQLLQFQRNGGAMAGSANNGVNPNPPRPPAPMAGTTNPIGPVPSATNPNAQPVSAPSDKQSLAQFVQSRQQGLQATSERKPAGNATNATSSANTGPPRPGPTPATMPSHLVAQMQKLASKEGISGQKQIPSLKAPTPVPQLSAQNPAKGQAAAVQQSAPGQSSVPRPGERQRWQGIITWMGRENNDSPMIKMEAHVFALGAPQQPQGNIRPDLWPPVLELRPSNEQAVSTPELKAWIGQHKPAICSIARAQNTPENANRFHAFCRLLSEKNIYAIGSWTTPGTAAPRPTILIFSTGTTETVAGLVFPETGLPDIPKSTAAPQPPLQPQPQPQAQASSQPALQPGPSNPPPIPVINQANIQAILQKLASTPGLNLPVQALMNLPPEQQLAAIQKIQLLRLRLQKQQQQQQQQAQAGNPALAPRGANPMTMNLPGGAWGQGNPQANIAQGVNLGLNNNLGGGAQMTSFGYPGINMGQNTQMLPNGLNMSVPNMNLMNLNAMNMGAGMQLGTLGGMAAGNQVPGAMQQQQQQPGQGNGQQMSGESVQAFLQRNGLAGGAGLR